MLFMVIETFTKGSEAVGIRFALKGRMMPEGVSYEASWGEVTGTRCFQLMRAPDRAILDVWIAHWSDLVDFEVAHWRGAIRDP